MVLQIVTIYNLTVIHIINFSAIGFGWEAFVTNDQYDGLGFMYSVLRDIPTRKCFIGGSSDVANDAYISVVNDYRSDDLGNKSGYLL